MNVFLILLLIAIIYGTGAIIVLAYRRRQFKSGRQVVVDPNYLQRAERGTTVPQMFSFILTLILLTIVCILSAVMLLSYLESIGSLGQLDDLSGLASLISIFSLFALIPLTPLTIAVNCFWIYSNRILYGESKSTSNLVKIQRVTAWIAWIIYLIGGWIAVISYLISQLQVTASFNDLGIY